ncbi:hypothetical protein UCD39_17625 [Nitrospirillum sp. BR 11752]|uniref:hypothetical protein n=1 Tax=Nitrospirillum sp. BR 11752 TaxID=3104293 RepID=UPI002EA498CA|nr:hypothetical protein [Nitrospirillum sp. BR 11752]
MTTFTAALGLSPGMVPPRFAEALFTFQGALERCEAAGIPGHSVLAAALVELMPRLVTAYGADGVADMLATLAIHIRSDMADGGLMAGETTRQ